jgi:hypothetical protein
VVYWVFDSCDVLFENRTFRLRSCRGQRRRHASRCWWPMMLSLYIYHGSS